MSAAPGWYADPSGRGDYIRYWDGKGWANRPYPTQPAAPAMFIRPASFTAQQSVIVNNRRGGCNHALHAVLTLLTCGMWFPVWILCAIVQR